MSVGRLLRVAGVLAGLGFGAVASAGPRIVIDPGHGGTQEGALGPGGIREKDLSLTMARQLKEALERTLSAEVLLTRDRDVHLNLLDRVEYANRKKPDLFISIHANSMPTPQQRAKTEGIETYFLSTNASGVQAGRVADRENADSPSLSMGSSNTLEFILNDLARTEAHGDSSRLAYSVHQKLVAKTLAQDRGVQQAPFYVLTGVESPAILVEVGFISHPVEGKRLSDARYQAKVAEAISTGVRTFLDEVGRRERHPKIARP
jgi:N-acetylmuramoyl-L-alanine amidase